MRALVLVTFAAGCGRVEAPAPAPSVAPIAIAHDAAPDAGGPCPIANASLGPGLVVERWHVTAATPVAGEPCIDIVRADSNLYAVRVPTGDRHSAIEWQRTQSAIAITNAGMFHESGEPVGLVVAGSKTRGVDNAKFVLVSLLCSFRCNLYCSYSPAFSFLLCSACCRRTLGSARKAY